ncbi:hypothetical protein TIFTF001_005942, partial [Ficus carica]
EQYCRINSPEHI